ncbi:Hypothetical_protein [Hexamita inflata]|uniref:Hypothetical_protein n=1 Tax=Hexamita inflata TaxID=28002 RepID=A0AA86RIW7_9EUKA|nr:Hypothetical protein HINF_LOCUS62033 [Hexamita inflata]
MLFFVKISQYTLSSIKTQLLHRLSQIECDQIANHWNQNTTQPCLQGRCLLAYKGVTDFNSLISKNVSKMYLWKMSNLNDLWSKNVVKYYVICHLFIREFYMMELPYK